MCLPGVCSFVQHFNAREVVYAELRSCVKVEVTVLGYTVSVDVEQR